MGSALPKTRLFDVPCITEIDISNKMSSYQKEQAETLSVVQRHFESLERYFIDAGYSSPLMYMHNSPGLLRVKKQAKESER